MMMMNLSISQRTTKTCYALLSVLLVASLTFVVSSDNSKNRMANTMPVDNKVISRVLKKESDKLIYSRNYIAITKAADFTRLFPNGGDIVSYLEDFGTSEKSNPQFPIHGSSTTQKGAIFDSSSIEVVNAPDGVIVKPDGRTDIQVQFEGNRELRFTPVDDPFYFLHGQCVATSGFLEPSTRIDTLGGGSITIPQPVITSNSCRLNMCLGGGGFSCIAIYSGSAFVFNFGKVVALNNAFASQRRACSTNMTVLTFEAPPLPPPFPGTIVGGTGAFEGIEGSVTIATIAGTTGPIVDPIGSGPTFVSGIKPMGSIVQVISVKSNMPLPQGP